MLFPFKCKLTLRCYTDVCFLRLQGLTTSFSAIFQLYSQFVGAPHFSSLATLLGYQGIAVVIEELLKIVKSLVRAALPLSLPPPLYSASARVARLSSLSSAN